MLLLRDGPVASTHLKLVVPRPVDMTRAAVPRGYPRSKKNRPGTQPIAVIFETGWKETVVSRCSVITGRAFPGK